MSSKEIAHTPFGNYELTLSQDQEGWGVSVLFSVNGRVAFGRSKTEAKVKAQKDFETRIENCFYKWVDL